MKLAEFLWLDVQGSNAKCWDVFLYIKASRQKKVFASPHIKHQAHSYKSCLICLWVWVELTQNTAIYTHDWYCFVEPGPSTVSKTGKPQIGALHQIHLVPPKDRLFAINSLSSAWEFPLRLGKIIVKFPRFENPLFCVKFATSWVTCWHVKWIPMALICEKRVVTSCCRAPMLNVWKEPRLHGRNMDSMLAIIMFVHDNA